jgi:1-acyl-sn-glycerol-3-phosphate acyltransferase
MLQGAQQQASDDDVVSALHRRAQVSRLKASWRLFRAVQCALGGALLCLLYFPRLNAAQRMDHVKRWSLRMLKTMGVRMNIQGKPQGGSVLWVANHVSWLDILAINAVRPARFVSKAGIRHWPVLGFMVASGGTLFIERERKRDALRVVHQMAQALQAGDLLAVFPEGTTSAGPKPMPFHANLLQAAISTQTPIQAVALRYSDAQNAFSLAAAYVGEMSLLRSVWSVARAREMVVHVNLLPPPAIEPDTVRHTLALQLHEAVCSALMTEHAQKAASIQPQAELEH